MADTHAASPASPASPGPIRIESDGDWALLTRRGLTTVLDPMVFRAGEIFLRGRSGRALGAGPDVPLDEARAWDFLDKNLLALGFFLDALILNERLPLFNYGDTFDQHLNFEQRSFAAFNDADRPAIETVDVAWSAYMPIKQGALDTLTQQLGADRPAAGGALTQAEAQSIVDELSHVEFQWDVGLGPELEQRLASDLDRRLGRFLLGGMIFGGYADRLQSEHWVQPKRARLLVQATAGNGAPTRDDEQQLFAWLAARYELPALTTWQPTFLHRVLQEATSLRDVPRIVARLRASGAVADYRAWRAEALSEWRQHGGIREGTARTIERLKRALTAPTTAGGALGLAADASVAWVEATAAPTPASVVRAGRTAWPLVEQMRGLVPGHRHVKLLAESAHARGRYPHIERSVRTLWAAA